MILLKYVKQFGIILTISFVGEVLNNIIPLPVPSSIYGIVIMLLCLKFKVFPVSAVKEASSFLIEIMPLLFVPATVGLIDSWQIIKPSILPYLVITVVTTILVMAVSGLVTQAIIKLTKKRGVGKDE